MRALAFVAALALFAACPVAQTLAAGVYGQQKVAYHINSDGDRRAKGYYGALINIQNHIDAVGIDDIEVVVVLHGAGVDLLRWALDDEKLRERVDMLKMQGVRFQVCERSLTAQHIDPRVDLYDVGAEDIVPSGVAELSRLQMAGFTYIKP